MLPLPLTATLADPKPCARLHVTPRLLLLYSPYTDDAKTFCGSPLATATSANGVPSVPAPTVQCCPPSLLRKTPFVVAARTIDEPAGSKTIFDGLAASGPLIVQ